MRAGKVILLGVLGGAAAAAAMAIVQTRATEPHTPPRPVPPEVTRRLPKRAPVSGERVVLIRKTDRVLALYQKGKLTATYAVALGRAPEGHKQREGDRRTPEGEYYVCTRNANSQFHLFLGLSYPNARDAETARKAKLISEEQREAIVSANRQRQRPPWDTPLGGEIGIHGGGIERDWTWGCIALENAAIEDLWKVLKLGDPVMIEP